MRMRQSVLQVHGDAGPKLLPSMFVLREIAAAAGLRAKWGQRRFLVDLLDFFKGGANRGQSPLAARPNWFQCDKLLHRHGSARWGNMASSAWFDVPADRQKMPVVLNGKGLDRS